MKSLSVLALLAAALMAASNFAGPREDERDAIRSLRGVPPPELPARAAQVVNAAPAASRSVVATAVLEAIEQRAPASAPAVRTALVNAGVVPSKQAPPVAAAPKGNGNGNAGQGNGNAGQGNGNSGNGNGNHGGNVPPPQAGGNGQVHTPNGNSRFPTAPPHGGNPPGHNGQPQRKGPPAFVDYTKPRSF